MSADQAPPAPEGTERVEVGTLTPVEATPADLEVGEVIGLSGKPAKMPSGVWYAATDGQGNLATDAEGRPIRVHPPTTVPTEPLGGA